MTDERFAQRAHQGSERTICAARLAEGLRDEITGAIVEDDQQLVKFHGMYLQDDRDLRPERAEENGEGVRLHDPRAHAGRRGDAAQWLALDEVARTYAQRHHAADHAPDRATARHHQVEPEGDDARRSTPRCSTSIAACGDVNRNVMCNPNPDAARAHAAALELARAISAHLTPRTPAYREIWLDGERIAGGEEEAVEPIYGKTYLPRKFKIVVAVPPSNDVDIFAHDLGFIAILDEAGDVTGWNVTVGGGMGMTHGEPETYPRTADVMGFLRNRRRGGGRRGGGDRAARLGRPQEPQARAAEIHHRGPRARRLPRRGRAPRRHYASRRPSRSRSPRPATATAGARAPTAARHLTLFVQNGRLADRRRRAQLSALRKIAQMHDGDFRITANQNLIVANVPADKQKEIHWLAAEAGLLAPWSGLRRNAMACVALPTCGLALAESERYLPDLIDALDARLAAHGLSSDDIVIRMTGCPNGCARPYLAEIGFVGKGPGRYNLYLGAAFDGSRLSSSIAETSTTTASSPRSIRSLRLTRPSAQKGERFGDFTHSRRLRRGDRQWRRLSRQYRRAQTAVPAMSDAHAQAASRRKPARAWHGAGAAAGVPGA